MVVVEDEDEGKEAGGGRIREVEVGRLEVDVRSLKGVLILRGSSRYLLSGWRRKEPLLLS